MAIAAPNGANIAIQLSLPVLGNQVQSLAFDAMDGRETSTAGYVVAPAAGFLGGGVGLATSAIMPGMGPLFANGVGSFAGNWWQNNVEHHMKQHPQQAQ